MTERRGQSIGDRQTLERAIDDVRRDSRRQGQEDILIDGTRRILLRSPNGNYWDVGVTNAGALTLTNVGATPI